MTTMNVSLTPALVKIVQDKVATGLYGNASEVIREAIRKMGTHDDVIYEAKLARLKEALAPGLADLKAGRIVEFSMEQLNAEMDKEFGTDAPV